MNPSFEGGVGELVATKVRVFAATLGTTRSDWRYLREQLLAGVGSARARLRHLTEWGDVYEVIIEGTGRNGRVRAVRTAWILPADGPRTRLVTAYVDLS